MYACATVHYVYLDQKSPRAGVKWELGEGMPVAEVHVALLQMHGV